MTNGDDEHLMPGPGSADLAAARQLVDNVRKVVKGYDRAIELICAAALAGGHALVEDLPGTGKTTAARAFARSVGGDFQRVQGTADLLPSDITGANIWDQSQSVFSLSQARSSPTCCWSMRSTGLHHVLSQPFLR